MGIATLGKSLLSSAKKKAKKGQQLGLFAGAAIGVAGIANSVIRRKAMDRANAFEKSLTPVKKALDKDFLQLVSENVIVYRPMEKEYYTPKTVIDKYKI